jgi:hypothetical protein
VTTATGALTVLALVLGVPGLAAAAHLGLLAFGSVLYREPGIRADRPVRFRTLVPAHDE